MRKFLALLLFAPALAISQDNANNVVTADRLFPKPDKIAEFEKALAAHAQKYHKGEQAWRVFEIMSGPDAGGYHITEGPTSWTAYDTRGDISADHNSDFLKSISIHLGRTGSSSFATYNAGLSTAGLTEWTDKIIINHWYPKPGKNGEMADVIARMKNMWTADGDKIAVYNSWNSGPPQFTLVSRLTKGLKGIDEQRGRKSFSERYSAANSGSDGWAKYLDAMESCMESRWSEVLFYRADLSSK